MNMIRRLTRLTRITLAADGVPGSFDSGMIFVSDGKAHVRCEVGA